MAPIHRGSLASGIRCGNSEERHGDPPEALRYALGWGYRQQDGDPGPDYAGGGNVRIRPDQRGVIFPPGVAGIRYQDGGLGPGPVAAQCR